MSHDSLPAGRSFCDHDRETCPHYRIDIHDCAGLFHFEDVVGRDNARKRVAELVAKYKGKCIDVCKPCHVDLDDDGLTEDEWEGL